MNNERRTIIGEVSVAVKADLYVDDETARTCMDLLAIHFRNLGWKGVVLRFEAFDHEPIIQSLLTEEAVETAMMAPWSCKKGENEE